MSDALKEGPRVHLLEGKGLPRGLAQWVAERLPAPFAGGRISAAKLDFASCRDRHRNQLDAGRLLEQIRPPRDGEVNMALVGTDLFYSVMTYVFGLTELGGRRGVLSCSRLGDELAGRVEVLRQRTLVEIVHEVGHGLGLVHCPVGDCAMHRTLWPEGIDIKRAEYCPTCLEGCSSASC